MARAARKTDASFELPFVPAPVEEAFELGTFAPGEMHARRLQMRLSEAYAGEAIERDAAKLHPAARLGIIVGGAGTLWAIIGAGALALLG